MTGEPSPVRKLIDYARAGDLAAVNAALDASPSLPAAGDEQGVPLVLALAYNGAPDVARLLLERGAPVDVFTAAALGEVERLRAFIQRDPGEIKRLSGDGWTPLHLAAFFGHKDAVRMLIANGADVHAWSTNDLHNQPLHAAAAGDRTEAAQYLIDHQADVSTRQHGGWTPLHAAAANGNRLLAQALLAAGSDPAATNDAGETPLTLAEGKGHAEVAELLRRYGSPS